MDSRFEDWVDCESISIGIVIAVVPGEAYLQSLMGRRFA